MVEMTHLLLALRAVMIFIRSRPENRDAGAAQRRM
jgi:hypothetical protein